MVVEELSPDDDAWLDNEPSASLELSWIEDDLQDTPVDDLPGAEPVTGSVPAAPEMKLTPPPASRKPISASGANRRSLAPGAAANALIRRPVVERVRPRAELVAEARVAPRPALRRPPIVVVQALPSRRGIYLAYAGAVLSGIASGVAVLLLGQ